MPKITRENHNEFRAKAHAAHLQRLETRRKAQQLAQELLTGNPIAQARVSISVQLSVLHHAMLYETEKLKSGKIKGTRLAELSVVQGELLRQLAGIGGSQKLGEGLQSIIKDDPEVAMDGVVDAAKSVYSLPGSDTVV